MSVFLVAALLMAHPQKPVAQAPLPTAITVKEIREMEGMRAIALAPGPTGSKFVVSLEDKSVRLIDAASRQTLRIFTGHPQPVYAVAWSADGEYVASGDESGRIFVWDVHSGQKVRTFYGDHVRGIQRLSFNLPRTLLISTGKDDVINVYNLENGKHVAKLLGNGINLYSGMFNPKTDVFVAGTLTTGARVYRITPDGTKCTNFLTGHDNLGVLDVGWNWQGTRAISTGKDSTAILWDMKSFARQGTLKGHTDWVIQGEFAPSGRIAATSSSDRSVRIWDTKTYQQIGELDQECGIGSPLAFTSDGKFLLTVGVDDYLQINSVNPPQPAAPEKPAKPIKASRRARHGSNG